MKRVATVPMPSRRATTSTASGTRPTSSCASRNAVAAQVVIDSRVELAPGECDLTPVRRHGLRPLDEHDPRLALGFVERNQYGRSLTALDVRALVDRRRHGREPLSDLGKGEAALLGCEPGPRRRTTRPVRLRTRNALLASPPGHHRIDRSEGPPIVVRATIEPTPCETPAPMDWNLATAFESVCDAIPDRVALIQGDRRVPVAIIRRSCRPHRGRVHRTAGLKPDSKVASYLYNCNEYTEALYGTFKIRGVPVNVNYRYLEDELVYLLDNSDAEVLLFHGSLGDHVAKVRDRAPLVKLWIQVDDGSPHQEFAVEYEDLIARTDPMPRDRAQWRRPLLPLHRRHDRHAEGRHVARRGSLRRPRRRRLPARGAHPARHHGRGRPDREVTRRHRARTACTCPRRRSCTAPARSRRSRHSSSAASIVTLVGRHFDPHELWSTVRHERVTQMAIVGDAFAKPMFRARRGRGQGHAVRRVVVAAHHQFGRDVVGRGEAWAHGARQHHLLRLARLE